MKFSLILLVGLCTFAAAATKDIFDDIPDVEFIKYEPIVLPRMDIAMPAIINDYIFKATNEFNTLVQKFKDISGTLKAEVKEYIHEKQSQITDKAAGLLQEVKDLSLKGTKFTVCSSKHQNELKEISNAVTHGIAQCANDVAAALKEFAAQVLSASLDLVADFNRLKEIAMDCYHKSTIGAAKCVYDNFDEFKELVQSVIEGTKNTIEAFKVHGQALIDSVKSCNENQYQKCLIQYQSIKTALIECANN